MQHVHYMEPHIYLFHTASYHILHIEVKNSADHLWQAQATWSSCGLLYLVLGDHLWHHKWSGRTVPVGNHLQCDKCSNILCNISNISLSYHIYVCCMLMIQLVTLYVLTVFMCSQVESICCYENNLYIGTNDGQVLIINKHV